MTPEQFAEALAELAADAKDGGFSGDAIAAELIAKAKAVRLCLDE